MKSTDLKPGFTVGTQVRYKQPDLYGETTGKIISIERIYQRVFDDGTFDPDGLCHIESDISSIAIPYEFDGETLTIHYPEDSFMRGKTERAKFRRFAYTVESAKMRTLMNGKHFTAIK